MSTETLKQAIATQQIAESTQKKELTIFDYLKDQKDAIAKALPKHMNADRMVRLVTTEIRKVPDLLKCNPISLFSAVVQCSQLGLEPNGLGHAYLLPYYNNKIKGYDVQLIIGYRGMLDLARRSGQILSINAYEVYDTDVFEVMLGLNPDIIHKRDIKTSENGKLIAVYAVAKLKDGGTQFEVMTKYQIDLICNEALSKIRNEIAKQYSPWAKHYNEMAKKTVIRRLFKYLPISVEMQRAVIIDEYADAGIKQDYSDAIDISTFNNTIETVDEDGVITYEEAKNGE